jgi:hypothetical protein
MNELQKAVYEHLRLHCNQCIDMNAVEPRISIHTATQVWLGHIEILGSTALLTGTHPIIGLHLRIPNKHAPRIDLAEPDSLDRIVAWVNEL